MSVPVRAALGSALLRRRIRYLLQTDLGRIVTSKLICCLKSLDVRIGLTVPRNRKKKFFFGVVGYIQNRQTN
jgi:hypothetical protein